VLADQNGLIRIHADLFMFLSSRIDMKNINLSSKLEFSKQSLNEQLRFALLRRKQVEIQVGLSRSAIYKLMAIGLFPKPIKITNKAVAWQQSAINAWIESKITSNQELKG